MNNTNKIFTYLSWLILFFPAFATLFYDPSFSYLILFSCTYLYIKEVKNKSNITISFIWFLYVFFMIFPPYHIFIRPILHGIPVTYPIENTIMIMTSYIFDSLIKNIILAVLFGLSLFFLCHDKKAP
ncbi:hypothetical protein F991_03380 [Acinetobacter sp. CIP-A165]|nr:hypothetical protein F991_03380 [Acinetobacter sp. CIP-A165]